MASEIFITVTCEGEFKDACRDAAKAEDRTLSNWVRWILNRELQRLQETKSTARREREAGPPPRGQGEAAAV